MNLLADFMVSFEVRKCYSTWLFQVATQARARRGEFDGRDTATLSFVLTARVILLQDELTLLLSSLPVLLYSGQLDIIIGAATTERYLQDIVWEGNGSVQ